MGSSETAKAIRESVALRSAGESAAADAVWDAWRESQLEDMAYGQGNLFDLHIPASG